MIGASARLWESGAEWTGNGLRSSPGVLDQWDVHTNVITCGHVLFGATGLHVIIELQVDLMTLVITKLRSP